MASTSKGICYLAFVTESRDAVLDELKHIFRMLPTESTEMNFSKRRLMLSCL